MVAPSTINAGLGVIGGLIANGNSLPTVDMASLLNTINTSGQYQRQLINSLPDEIRQNLLQYSQQMGAGGAQYQSAIQGLSDSMQQQAGQIYGPNSDAAAAEKAAAKTDIYSTLPGTQNAIRNAMAATGGLGRGSATTALTQPVLQAAQTYGKTAAGVDADQTKMGQTAQMQALQATTTMDAAMFQQLFGMTKEQATEILSSGNAMLSNQLSQLITQNTSQTGQTLNVEGLGANNGMQNAQIRNGQQNAIWTGLAGLGLDGAFADNSSSSDDNKPVTAAQLRDALAGLK